MTVTYPLPFDAPGKREYHYGVSRGMLYPKGDNGSYEKGVNWVGLTNVTASPEGGEIETHYADNMEYATLTSPEKYKGSITAFTYPDEFEACDGTVEIAPGATVGQQTRKRFGLSYVTNVGNDVDENAAYILHIVFDSVASPSEKESTTVNESKEPAEFSWDFESKKIPVKGAKNASAGINIRSDKTTKDKLTQIEDILYGKGETPPRMPTPDEIVDILNG